MERGNTSQCSINDEVISKSRIQDIAIAQGDSNMTGTDLCVNKPHCAAAVRP